MGTREDDIGDRLENLDYYMSRLCALVVVLILPAFVFYDAYVFLNIDGVSQELFTIIHYLIFVLVLSGFYSTYHFYSYITS